jgi:hypothetical protein
MHGYSTTFFLKVQNRLELAIEMWEVEKPQSWHGHCNAMDVDTLLIETDIMGVQDLNETN